MNETLLRTELKDLMAFEGNKTELKNVYWGIWHFINGVDDTMEVYVQFNTHRYLSKG